MKHIFVFGLLLVGCSVGPQPINYGHDACVFCKMTIVDRQHAAEIVTEKGKVYKYDAVECMINDLREWDKPNPAHYLVNDYGVPGKLIDAKNAHYLITQEIPSPMGEFLTAFSDIDMASKIQGDAGGDQYTWVELQEHFKQ